MGPTDPQAQTTLRRVPQDNKTALEVDDDYQMGLQDFTVRALANAGAIAITLPEVTRAGGGIYSIDVPDVADGGTTTVVTLNGTGLPTALTLDADGDGVVLYSDGLKWIALANNIA